MNKYKVERVNWKDTARQYARNAEYYKGLLIEIGSNFGEAAFLADVGTLSEDILVAKLPELVAHLCDNWSKEMGKFNFTNKCIKIS